MEPASEVLSTAASTPALATRKPAWLKRILLACAALLMVLMAAVLALPYALPWLLQQQGVDLHWQNPQWRFSGFTASQVQLSLPRAGTQPHSLHIEKLRIDWAWQAFPIQHVQAQRLEVQWPINENDRSAEESEPALPKALLKWLPQHIQLQEIDAKLLGLGHLQGSLTLQAGAQGKLWQPRFIHSQLTLAELQGAWLESIPAELRPTQLSAHITTHPDQQDNPDGQQLLSIDVHSLGPTRLQLNGLLDLQQSPDWHGRLNNAQLFVQLDALTHPKVQAEQLQARLYFTGQANTQTFALQLAEHSSLELHNLHIAEQASAQKLTVDLTGLNIEGLSTAPNQLKLTSPLTIQLEKLSAEQLHAQDWQLTGSLSGQLPEFDLNSQLSGEHGLVLSSTIQLRDELIQGSATLQEVSFTAANPLQKTFVDWPESAVLDNGQLRSQVDFNTDHTGVWTVSLGLNGNHLNAALDTLSVKNVQFELNSQFNLKTTSNWHIALNQGQLVLQLDELDGPDLHAHQLQARTNVTGHFDSDSFTLNFSENTRIKSNTLQLPERIQGQTLNMHLANLSVQGSSNAVSQALIHSPITVQVKHLHSAQLHNQDWDFSGTLSGQLSQLKLNGQLTGEHGLNFDTQVRILEHSTQGHATLKDVFFRGSNPLQKTLKDWPKLLSLNSGRLRSRMDFSLPESGPTQLSLKGSASGLNGIINRSELKNMNLGFTAQLTGQSLSLHIPHLTIEQLNPGVPLTSLQLNNVAYRTSINTLLKGVANWQSVQVQLLNGRAWLDTQQLDLSRPQQVLLHVAGLELQELFRVYPAEGLAGNGIIDGQLPLHIEHAAVYIEAGQLQARAPGVLQFQSEKIQALGRSNPAMRIVADALDDFHFNLLSSGLSYDQSGKLLLNVRLEGQNPDVEKGRPIHLNISLEEDIPALLASIQLSGQVSEIIQKRVRERLEKR